MKRQVPEGTQVRFRHERLTHGPTGALLPRGGSTECKLTLPDGSEVVAYAECLLIDNYSKKIGRDISLGRALVQAEQKHPELFKKGVAA